MPLGKNVRYRVHTTKTGKKIRLAFKGNTVIEAKNLKTGKIHTPSEFARDKKKSKMRRINQKKSSYKKVRRVKHG